MADLTLTQNDFSGGVFESRDGPANTAYTLMDALVDDTGKPFRRGGCANYSSADAGDPLVGLADVYLAKGQTTLAWTATDLFELDGALAPDAVPAVPLTVDGPRPGERLEALDGCAVWMPEGAYVGSVYAWAGSAKTAAYTTGTVTVTANSASVTGTGTAWAANVDPGMILHLAGVGTDLGTAVVKTVNSDTQITLTAPWRFEDATGSNYFLTPVLNVGSPAGGEAVQGKAVVANRLLVGSGSRVFFTDPFKLAFREGDFHEMPGGGQVLGIAGLGPQTAVVFTTRGVYAISGLAFDPLDPASGDQQHEVTALSRDLILWDERGLAGWAGGLIVPALDDVYVFTLTEPPVPVSAGIRRDYRAYVESGARPGTASVYRGHLHLPIVDGSSAVDMRVCRLDRGSAWTQWNVQARGVATAVRAGSGEPRLLGTYGERVMDLTGCYTPGAGNKADPLATHVFALATRAFDLSAGAGLAVVEKVRVRYELVDAAADNPTLSFVYATTETNGVTVSAVRGGTESDGTGYSVWRVGKKAERMFFGLVQSGAAAQLRILEIEVFVRKAGI